MVTGNLPDANIPNNITIDTASAAPASGLTGNTLASGVTASSLTSVGTLTSLTAGTTTITGLTHLKGSAWNSILRLGDTSRSGEQLTHINNGSVNFSIYTSNGTKGVLTANHDGSAMTLGADYGSGTLTVTPPTTFSDTVTIGTQQGSKELMTNRARMRHIDGVADANASFSHGDLYVNHISTGNIYMQRNTTFAGGTTTFPVGGILRFGERGNLTHHSTSYDMTFNTNSTANAMVIKGTGNIAIGGTGGYQKLSVESGNIYMSAGYNITWANGNATIGESGYSLLFNTYDGSSVSNALTLAGNNSATFAGGVTVNSSTTTAGLTSSNVIYSQMSSTSDYGNTGLRTLDGNSHDGVRIEHGGGNGRILLYSANSHRGTMDANKFTCHTNGQTLGTTANESVLFLQNNGNAARITTSKTFETYGGFYSHSNTAGYDHGFTTHTNEYNPIVNWPSGQGRVHYNYRMNNTHTDYTFYNGSSGGFPDIEAGSFTTTSDYRLKKTVTDYTDNVCDSIKDLRPVTYFWKASTKMHTAKQLGFLAHELQEKLPLSVKGEKDATNEKGDIDPQTIKTEALATYIIKGMQEIIKRLEVLEAN
jgi:hypothetical protein